MSKNFTFKGKVKKFPQKGGWHYVSTGMTYEDLMIDVPKWGLVPAEIMLGETTWKKSLLPYGDGTLFVSLSRKIRDAEGVTLGDEVEIKFKLLGF